MAEYKLSKFQTWTLFVLFHSDDRFTLETIVRRCCSSAMIDLDPQTIEGEVDELRTLKYIRYFDGYSLTPVGIAYVRKILAAVEVASESGDLPQRIIDEQEPALRSNLVNRVWDSTVFINAVLTKVGKVMNLIITAVGLFG